MIVYVLISYHMESEMDNTGRLKLNHILRKGLTPSMHYGLALATSTALPKTILEDATRITEELDRGDLVMKNNIN